MTNAVAGWYDDGSGRKRWWDGTQWTEHFADQHPAATAAAKDSTESKKPKISFFGGKKAALELSAENERLQALIEKHGLADVAALDAVKVELQSQIELERANQRQLESTRAGIQAELAALEADILSARNQIELQSYGLYDYEHPAESSTDLAVKLESIRSQIKDLARAKKATLATANFTFNNSQAKGRKFVADMSNLLLRAYNAEAENCVKSVRAGNLATATKRLATVADQIARQGSMIQLHIAPRYHELRLQELGVAADHLRVLQVEKELERAHREELREQRKAEQELQREQEKLEKEKSHYLSTLAALEAKGDLEGVERMRERLADVERALADVEYRAANIRAGHVYVISNVGSFGPDVVKIGMTRRLEPMDRVQELGDASVPFRFDVHALFFADDAVGIEAMLHKSFDDRRINKINLRREYFRVTPNEVLEVLKEHSVELVEFTLEPDAAEFRASDGATTASAATPG